jgi:hypothetical protein
MNKAQPFLKRRMAGLYGLSYVLALLMAAVSVLGLVAQTSVYPSEALRKTFVPNDVVNLLIGLPVLLGSMSLARRGRLLGLLFWPGALFYVFYNTLVYVLGMPFNLLSLAYGLLIVISLAALVGLLASLDGETIRAQLCGATPERLAGGVLAGLGALFFLRVIGVAVNALTSQTALPQTEWALNTADFLITPAWMISGVLLWRRKTWGYLTALGALFQASMLFIGLILFFVLQPFLTPAPFALGDTLVIAVMGLVCFIPFGLLVRSVLLKEGK